MLVSCQEHTQYDRISYCQACGRQGRPDPKLKLDAMSHSSRQNSATFAGRRRKIRETTIRAQERWEVVMMIGMTCMRVPARRLV